jgi:hypothetical protein
MESLVLAYRDGYAKRELYEPTILNLSDFIAYPGMQDAWELRKRYFHEALRKLVDDKISAARSGKASVSLYREEQTKVPE